MTDSSLNEYGEPSYKEAANIVITIKCLFGNILRIPKRKV